MRQVLTGSARLLAGLHAWAAPAPPRPAPGGQRGHHHPGLAGDAGQAGPAAHRGPHDHLGGKASYCIPRLLVETLDAQGQVTAERMGFIPGTVGGYDKVYFEEPVRAPGPAYRVTIASWDKCAGGQ